MVKLQGLIDPPLSLTSISAIKVYNATKGNEVWAFVLVDQLHSNIAQEPLEQDRPPPELQSLLHSYKDVFNDPQTLPPPRSYDHAIPLTPGAVPINSKPYHYSSFHKIEIENQVKQLLQAGLIAHSHSPFASLVLLVKKKMAPSDFVLITEN